MITSLKSHAYQTGLTDRRLHTRIGAMLLAAQLAAATSAAAQDTVEPQTVVIVIGSKMTQAGFAGDAAPRTVFPTIVGYPKDDGVMVGMGQKDAYYGDEAQARRGMLNMVQLVRRGRVIGSSDAFQGFVQYIFYNELRVAPEEHPVVVAISDVVEEPQARQLLELLFDHFNVLSAYVTSRATLGVYASGRTTALAIHMTHEGGNIVPVIEGRVLPEGVDRLPVGLDRQTTFMSGLLTRRGYEITDKAIIEDIVKTKTYVAANYDDELERARNADLRSFAAGPAEPISTIYETPDGETIGLTAERFMVPEALFQPSVASVAACGLHECIANTIARINVDYSRQLAGNIVLMGYGSMTPGLADRLASELQEGPLGGTPPKVIAASERQWSTWIGGSILASLSTFPPMMITKGEWEEGIWYKKLVR